MDFGDARGCGASRNGGRHRTLDSTRGSYFSVGSSNVKQSEAWIVEMWSLRCAEMQSREYTGRSGDGDVGLRLLLLARSGSMSGRDVAQCRHGQKLPRCRGWPRRSSRGQDFQVLPAMVEAPPITSPIAYRSDICNSCVGLSEIHCRRIERLPNPKYSYKEIPLSHF